MRKFIVFISLILAIGCNNGSREADPPAIKNDTVVSAPATVINNDSLLSATGKEILTILKNKQYDSLVHYFAPGDSVHFSPYGFIGSGAQTITAADFSALLVSNKKINWGDYDGSGDPIELTLKQYLEKFVYNADFLNAEKTAIDSFIGSGNSLNNLRKIYPGKRFIEYYFSGFDKKYEGMDWTCLRLVFKEQAGRYYLVAIVHDQWTI